MPLPKYLPCLGTNNSEATRDELIFRYFNQGYSNKEILAFLLHQHEIKISISTLKRRLKDLGLRRRNGDVEDREEITRTIQKELQGSGSSLG